MGSFTTWTGVPMTRPLDQRSTRGTSFFAQATGLRKDARVAPAKGGMKS